MFRRRCYSLLLLQYCVLFCLVCLLGFACLLDCSFASLFVGWFVCYLLRHKLHICKDNMRKTTNMLTRTQLSNINPLLCKVVT